jgi:thiamine-phosphate pyrophosphorylase
MTVAPVTPVAPAPWHLIAITDDIHDGRDALVARACAAARGGATMIQLRLKGADARLLADVAGALLAALPASVPLVLNDRADVALARGAAGVHLGHDDPPAAAVRRVAPPGFLIGASVGADAEVPDAAGADYVGIGPLYPTRSKSDAGSAIGLATFARLAQMVGIPAVAVGGITAATAGDAMAAGAAGVAAVAAIFGAPDPERAAHDVRSRIDAWVTRTTPS